MKKLSRLVSLSLIFSLVVLPGLNGCATDNASTEQKMKTENTAGGAAIGAGVGALGGYFAAKATGGDKKQGAVIGGVLGAAAGAATGYWLATRVAEMDKINVGKEVSVDQNIAGAQQINKMLDEDIQNADKDKNDLEAKITEVKELKKQNKITQDEMLNLKEEQAKKIDDQKKYIAKLDGKLSNLKSIQRQQKPSNAELDTQIAAIETKNMQLISQLTENEAAANRLNQELS